MKKITIVDYGSGNVLSAQKSFVKIAKDNNIEVDVSISKKLKDVKSEKPKVKTLFCDKDLSS